MKTDYARPVIELKGKTNENVKKIYEFLLEKKGYKKDSFLCERLFYKEILLPKLRANNIDFPERGRRISRKQFRKLVKKNKKGKLPISTGLYFYGLYLLLKELENKKDYNLDDEEKVMYYMEYMANLFLQTIRLLSMSDNFDVDGFRKLEKNLNKLSELVNKKMEDIFLI